MVAVCCTLDTLFAPVTPVCNFFGQEWARGMDGIVRVRFHFRQTKQEHHMVVFIHLTEGMFSGGLTGLALVLHHLETRRIIS